MRKMRLAGAILLASALLAGRALAQSPPPAEAGAATLGATVRGIDADSKALTFVPTDPQTVTAQGDQPQKALPTLAIGDSVQVRLDGKGHVTGIDKTNRIFHPDAASRLLLMAACAGLLLIVVTWASPSGPRAFVVGLDGRLSNSHCQLALWSVTVFSSYLTLLLMRLWYGWGQENWQDYLGGIAIPANVLAVSGLSALTFGGARAVTTQKNADAIAHNRRGLVRVRTKGNDGIPRLRDLFVNDDGDADIGDFQMILITAIAALLYGLKSYALLGRIELSPSVSMPDLDTSLLAGVGVGQGAYLVKKMASGVGKG
jgi:hypothetical protein